MRTGTHTFNARMLRYIVQNLPHIFTAQRLAGETQKNTLFGFSSGLAKLV
jgi:hypothetical protein